MKRWVDGSRVRYDDASRGWSLILFGSSAFVFLLIPGFEERSHDPTAPGLIRVAALVGIVLFLTSLWLLFRHRSFLIDFRAEMLTVTEKRLIGSSVRSFPLATVKVRSEQHSLATTFSRSSGYTLFEGSVWLEVRRADPLPFLPRIRGPYTRQVASTLSHDLGRPRAG